MIDMQRQRYIFFVSTAVLAAGCIGGDGGNGWIPADAGDTAQAADVGSAGDADQTDATSDTTSSGDATDSGGADDGGSGDSGSSTNSPPTASFEIVTSGDVVALGSVVQLDATASSDPDGDILSYQWSLQTPSGSQADIQNPTLAKTSFTPDEGGTYTVELVVNDGSVDSTKAARSVEALGPNAILPGDLAFSELMINPDFITDRMGEWVELYRTGSDDRELDLSNCKLSDSNNSDVLTYAPNMVATADFYLLAASNEVTDHDAVYADVTLNNTGDTLELSCDGRLIDAVTYPDQGSASGNSWQLDADYQDADAATDNDDQANWCTTSSVSYTDTRKAANDTCF